MHLIAIRNNFQFRVEWSTLKRYFLECVKDKCRLKLNIISVKDIVLSVSFMNGEFICAWIMLSLSAHNDSC